MKPREFWIDLTDHGDEGSWRADVLDYKPPQKTGIVHVREVMPDEPECKQCWSKNLEIGHLQAGIELQQERLDRVTRALAKAKETIKTFGVNLAFVEALKEIEAIERGEE